jgi:hypothetical protein
LYLGLCKLASNSSDLIANYMSYDGFVIQNIFGICTVNTVPEMYSAFFWGRLWYLVYSVLKTVNSDMNCVCPSVNEGVNVIINI